jgi:quercetin dioxygenase-like cupin family protein
MQGFVVTVAVTSLLLIPVAGAEAPGAGAQAQKGHEEAAARLVVMPAADLKWTDLDPKGAPGVQIAPLWGDHTTGAFGAIFRLPAGFSVPLHTHTHDMRVIFLSGTYVQQPEGREEFRAGPGGYMMQPGGNYRHATSCDKAAPCVFFVESDGAFDLTVVESGKSAG